jgi:hypothetical protein
MCWFHESEGSVPKGASKTVADMDVCPEPPWMGSRRVLEAPFGDEPGFNTLMLANKTKTQSRNLTTTFPTALRSPTCANAAAASASG